MWAASLVSGRLARLVRFGVTGIVSNLVLFGLFVALVTQKAPVLAATAMVYVAGICGTYVVNRAWSFDSKRRHVEAGPAYALAQACGLGVQLLIQWFFHGRLGYPAILVQAVSIPVFAVLMFAVLEWVVFPRSPR